MVPLNIEIKILTLIGESWKNPKKQGLGLGLGSGLGFGLTVECFTYRSV